MRLEVQLTMDGPRVFTDEGDEIEDVIAVRVRQEPGHPPEAYIEICPVEALVSVERVALKRHDEWPTPKLATEEELEIHAYPGGLYEDADGNTGSVADGGDQPGGEDAGGPPIQIGVDRADLSPDAVVEVFDLKVMK